ncbi:MAG: hypothetical protein U0892_17265 [Pirellulales bacterium]
MDEQRNVPAIPPFEFSQLNQVFHLQRAEKLTLASLGFLLGAMAITRKPIVASSVMLLSSLVLYRESESACLFGCSTNTDQDEGPSGRTNLHSQSAGKSSDNSPRRSSSAPIQLPLRVSDQPRAVDQTHNANTSVIPDPKSPRPENQQVDEAIDDSFPASDPPSYSGGTATPHTESPKQ